MNEPKRCPICMRPNHRKYNNGYCSKECCDKAKGQIPYDNKKYCLECIKEYIITENYQMTCLGCKDKLYKRREDIQEEKLNKICSCCNKTFRRKRIGNSQTQCDDCARDKRRRICISNSEKNNIESMKENRRRGIAGMSYEKLIAIEEKKRLFDERHWKDYTSGKYRGQN